MEARGYHANSALGLINRYLCVACINLAGFAEAPDAQSTRSDSVSSRSVDRNSLCAAGETANDGCDKIRARRIEDVTALPFRAIGQVNFAGMEHRSHCTGTMVSERVALTAAHCLYNEARAGWISAHGLQFAAGYQSGSSVAVSAVERYTVSPSTGEKGGDWKHTP